jgi:integrase
MMGDAVRRGILSDNPVAKVQDLPKEDTGIEILKIEEVRRLFGGDGSAVWGSSCVYAANKLAAFTGMRIGEILGLRGEGVFDDYIKVCGQYTRYGFRKTKGKEVREIPITALLRGELQGLININGRGYLFSEDRGNTGFSCFCARATASALNSFGYTRRPLSSHLFLLSYCISRLFLYPPDGVRSKS